MIKVIIILFLAGVSLSIVAKKLEKKAEREKQEYLKQQEAKQK